jgi:hypothetical protein
MTTVLSTNTAIPPALRALWADILAAISSADGAPASAMCALSATKVTMLVSLTGSSGDKINISASWPTTGS